jgi:hypothetical protein
MRVQELTRFFPYPWYLSLTVTWLAVIALYVLDILATLMSALLQNYCSFLSELIGLFTPIDFWMLAFAYGGLVALLNPSSPSPEAAYVDCVIPLVTLIIILGADWAMQKAGISPTVVKLLFNLGFLFALNVLVHMALWRTLNPLVVFVPHTFEL